MNLEEIKRRVEGATSGEWKAKGENNPYISKVEVENDIENELIVSSQKHGDIEFIAHARQDIPDLIAEVERLQDLVESYEDAFWDVIEASDLNFKDYLPKELLEGE